MKSVKRYINSPIHNRMGNANLWLIVGLMVGLFSACSNTRHIADGKSLLISNEIALPKKIDVNDRSELKASLAKIPVQKPNKKALGLWRLKLWFYTVADRKNENKLRWWMKNKVGEPPALFDESASQNSMRMMQNYLNNRGYFYNDVNYRVETKRKKTKVHYEVQPGKVFRISEVVFPSGEQRYEKIARLKAVKSLLVKGKPFDINVLKDERQRIATDLQDFGYYGFTRDHVSFELDSSKAQQRIAVKVELKPKEDSVEHELYYLNNVYVYTQYSLDKLSLHQFKDTLKEGNFYYINDQMRYKPQVLRNAIFFKHDMVYSYDNYKATISRLSDLGVFKFVNVKFKERRIDEKNYLDAYIYLTPAKRQSFTVDLEANNNFDGLLGSAVSYTYRNRNLLKRADLLLFNITSGVEVQFDKDLSFVNTADVTTELSYYLNKFVLPFNLKKLTKNTLPKTRFGIRYNFEKRIAYYTLHNTNLSFGYEWSYKQRRRHIVNPISVNLVRLSGQTQEFLDRINEIPALKNSFEEQLILGGNYTYLYSNQRTEKQKRILFLRGNVDVGGNLLDGIMSIAKKKEDRPHQFLGQGYSQFARLEGELRNTYNLNQTSSLVTRLNLGLGFSYGNSSVLPYVKQFYGGGTNSMRAFRVRTVGPGSYNDSTSIESGIFIDQTGDIKFEANVEYRFDIFKWIKGALFTDIGNVWLLRKEDVRPGGEFRFDKFHKDLTIGSGFGLRLDFNFFVIRMDFAIPVRDPSLGKSAWVIKDTNFRSRDWRRENLVFNLGIGYPF